MKALLHVERRPWRIDTSGAWTIASAGQISPHDLASTALSGPDVRRSGDLQAYLRSHPSHYGFIAESESQLIAACDPVRSFPIFYVAKEEGTYASNEAVQLEEIFKTSTTDETSLLEMLMAGYVTGRNTVVRRINQLLPGELLIHDKDQNECDVRRHYEFLGTQFEDDEERLTERLAAATEESFDEVIRQAGGRPIYVPLSGGLDSRLVLAMLRARGYDELYAFSYGAPRNEDAERAAIVADRLGVPWIFKPSTRKAARRMFLSKERQAYWTFSARHCSVPNMQEFLAFSELKRDGAIPDNAVVVNGQSGDFISGGHIRAPLLEPDATLDSVFDAVVDKHYGLWKMMITSQNLELLRPRFDDVLRPAISGGLAHPARLYEYWEWQERQSKFVVNQQRTYEFFDLDWALPLWSRAYCDFWPRVPLHLRLNQRLYRSYLKNWDFRGLFTEPGLNKTMIGWPGLTRVVPPVAKAVGVGVGPGAKNFIYNRMKYIGFNRHQLGSYPYGYFWKRASSLRNANSLYAESWLRGHYPEWMNDNFPIAEE